MFRTASHPILTLALAAAGLLASGFLAAPGARAEILTLDTDYSITHLLAFTRWPSYDYNVDAAGTNPDAPYGFSTMSVHHSGEIAFAADYPIQYGAGEFTLTAPNGDALTGGFTAEGFLHDSHGTWTLLSGANRFAGAQGGGSIRIDAGSQRIRLTGTVIPAIPEPPPLLLLALGTAVPLARTRRRLASGRITTGKI